MQLWPTITWALLALAALLAAWAVLADRPKGRLRCPGGWRPTFLIVPWRQGCWYDMSGLSACAGPGAAGAAPVSNPQESSTGVTCPECGRHWPRARSLRRRRIRWRFVAVAAMVALASYPAHVWPRVQKHGWWAGAPTWALVMFAPLDDYVRPCLSGSPIPNNPAAMAALPAATVEVIAPAWDRPFAAWEVELLCARLNAVTRRLHARHGGGFVGFYPGTQFESNEWWNWPKPFTLMEGFELGNEAFEAAVAVTRTSDDSVRRWWTRRDRVRLFGGDEACVRDQLRVLGSIDRATREGFLVLREPAGGEPGEQVVAYDVTDFTPAGLVPATRAGASRGGGVGPRYEIGDPVVHPETHSVTRLAHLVCGTGHQTAGVVRGVLLLRETPENQRRMLRVLEGARLVMSDPTQPVRGLEVGAPGMTATIIDVSWLPLEAGNDLGAGATATRAVNRLANDVQALMNGGDGTPWAAITRVGTMLVLIGDAEQLQAAGEEIERRRAEVHHASSSRSSQPLP